MKTLITIILTALLAACGDCPPEPLPTVIAAPVVVIPEPIVEAPSVKPEPVVQAPVVTPEPVTICPQSTASPCAPSPTPAPVRPIVIEPNPEPVCVRNTEPLVMINGTLTDNCGNKYGTVRY